MESAAYLVFMKKIDCKALADLINEATSSNLAPIGFLFNPKTEWARMTQAQKELGVISPTEVDELEAYLQLILLKDKEATDEYYRIGARLFKVNSPSLSKQFRMITE